MVCQLCILGDNVRCAISILIFKSIIWVYLFKRIVHSELDSLNLAILLFMCIRIFLLLLLFLLPLLLQTSAFYNSPYLCQYVLFLCCDLAWNLQTCENKYNFMKCDAKAMSRDSDKLGRNSELNEDTKAKMCH